MTTEIKKQEEFVIYQANDGSSKIEVRLENATIWLSQQQMADVFNSSRTNIIEHIKNIYSDGELSEQAMEKAKAEYRKYQQKTLSDVEVAYLETIKAIEKSVLRRNKK
ncbi:hypothetical protein FACS189446_7300 [Bacteroidia bacterium]|nr:hypothetical protein FACS189446_7300 [Bacteroidia bacterium]